MRIEPRDVAALLLCLTGFMVGYLYGRNGPIAEKGPQRPQEPRVEIYGIEVDRPVKRDSERILGDPIDEIPLPERLRPKREPIVPPMFEPNEWHISPPAKDLPTWITATRCYS